MNTNELLAVLRLQSIPNIGDVTAKKLIAHCGNPEAIFRDNKAQLLKIDGIGTYTLQGIHDSEHREAAESEYEFIEKNEIGFSYFMDADHPTYLKHCIHSPVLLFKRGNIDLQGRKIISVVGTRNITSYELAFCEKFVEDIALLNPIIVSGFAYGVDIAVQKAATKHGLQTIG